MPRLGSSIVSLVVTLTLGTVRAAGGQELAAADAEPGPRFLLASASRLVPLDVDRTPALARRLELSLDGVTLKRALEEIARRAGLRLAFSDNDVPLGRRVYLRAEAITLAAALTDVLLGTGLDVVFGRDGGVSLVKRPPYPLTGSVAGRVRNAQSGEPIEGAELFLQGTRWRTLAGSDGEYRLADVDTGTYTLTARRIGYTSQSRSVTVAEGQEVTADFALQAAVTKLDELVTTTPGGMQTQIKALSSPITVITAADIERQRPQTINDVLRQAVPSAVGFDVPGTSVLTAFTLRGASTLTSSSATVKVFVDGVQAANSRSTPVDPQSIERIEVIRGPQAAAVYGPDAAGGVIQIYTKRGVRGQERPEVRAQAEFGVQQTPYVEHKAVVRQSYDASIEGGTGDAIYALGVGYWRLPDWLPRGQPSSESVPSVYGGLQFERGIVNVDLAARYQESSRHNVFNPEFFDTGLPVLSRPFLEAYQHTNQTVSAQLGIVPRSWWRNRLNVGIDHFSTDEAQQGPRLTTPDDTLLRVGVVNTRRTFASYNTSVQWRSSPDFVGTLTAGLDYYRLFTTLGNAFGALNTDGTIRLDPTGAFNLSRTRATNTGYFAQLEVGLNDQLFLTAGVRADRLSTLGPDFGTPVSPRMGLAYTHELGDISLKTRASWGRAIRAPSPGEAVGQVTAFDVTLANPLLAPERQRGWDGGLDIVFGNRGSVSLTGYNQTAENLILYVQVATDPVPTYQYQNVGRVKNRGVEIEGSLSVSAQLQLRLQYAFVHSRIRDLGPSFSGDERVGDRPRGVPAHTAGGTVTFVPGQGTTLTAGVTYVGSVREYDNLALFRCFGGTGPCRATNRDYIEDYADFVKLNATLSQQITPQLLGFASVKNLTNNTAHEGLRNNAVLGRLTSFGLQLHF